MSTFRKALTAIAVLLVLLTAAPSIFAGDHEGAYTGGYNKSDLYGGFGGHQWNSRNVPAGTVVDPGSQVLYIVDTGVNLREEAGNESGDTELLNAK